MKKITITYDGECSDKPEDEMFPTRRELHMNVREFYLNVHGMECITLEKLENILTYYGWSESAKKRLRNIIALSSFFLLLDVFLFFVLPFLFLESLNSNIGFSPIPIGATIAICGIQGGLIATLFHQYKTEITNANYIFRGKEAYPYNREE